jgi:GNAT superfamily N-acetyltransferase
VRIRDARAGDLPALIEIQHEAARHDGGQADLPGPLTEWLSEGAMSGSVVFVLMDDDDEQNTWGQAGTLEGLEGEIIGYTVLRLLRDEEGYHFRCEGAIRPPERRRGGGRALLICALNRASLWGGDIELEAEEEGLPIFFEALFPCGEPAAARLAAKCELEAIGEPRADGQQLYRRVLFRAAGERPATPR